MSMFCNQCQEALNNLACEKAGVCGKDELTSNLMDVLIGVVKSVSFLTHRLNKENIETRDSDDFMLRALFMTVTNVNFDSERIISEIKKGVSLKDQLISRLGLKSFDNIPDLLKITYKKDIDDLISDYKRLSTVKEDEDIQSLKSLILLGLKGMAAYAHHALVLNKRDEELLRFMHKALSILIESSDTKRLLELVLETGKFGVSALKLLDEANTEMFGHPEITSVFTGLKEGPAILISGHDLLDLYELLIQTENSGINIYTHGEMLPAHAYPKLKKFKHLAGHFGTAWHNQRDEFRNFNGAILFTTNCIQKPDKTYMENVFTTGTAGFPGCTHIEDRKFGQQKDFTELINKAISLGGVREKDGGHLTIGFGHNTIFSVADKIIAAIKTGRIRKFVVMAGCDGRQKQREYYTDFAKGLPEDTIILTAGCAKFRYNHLDLGNIDGIPRIIDAGQCNDSYSLAITAIKLKEVFGLDDINKLPIVYNIAWYEQKAVIVLLALLYLGVKNIRLGPTLPPFISKNVTNILIENFGIKGINSPQEDLKEVNE